MTWADSFSQLLECGVSKRALRSSLKRLAQVEQEIGLDLTKSFLNPSIGRSSTHGSEHVVRVMWWVLVLARHASLDGQLVSDEETTAALYAAFCHDLARQNEWVDREHGQNAAEHFQTHLAARLPEDLLKRCLKAMRVHSEPDPHDDDVVWMLLKDADSLDRGRFGPPPYGCDPSMLRLRILKENELLRDACTWAAYWLAGMRLEVDWLGNDPCRGFARAVEGMCEGRVG